MRPVNNKQVTQIFVETVPAPRKSAANAKAVGETSLNRRLVKKSEPPWKTFKKCYKCNLAGTIAVIRRYPSKDANRILEILCLMHHKNVIAVSECFHPSDAFYTLSNFLPLTLDYIKYIKDDRAVGINNLKHWEKCSAAVEFLSAMTSASSFKELKQFALISACTFYSYISLLEDVEKGMNVTTFSSKDRLLK
ncbi:uncharacterized protein P174DRAFT_464611 [Aspergillus novofumigatus IBT 16806]|uniref:Protein kinase domain-containing protein n=1 Tax=Aspergillus novofumigatus (strain IBT 16806) TaxID=1392255 RepID=A0A2I1BU42_ASPN1|nr:uncharacterized protein P174DRAFT_464611 [Aspergillus novofumigatus IBT 16806]PKX88864.1 hypothetical protein P174DRAFT_464611 [Aspergillus novofumigatus IBT 16806]